MKTLAYNLFFLLALHQVLIWAYIGAEWLQTIIDNNNLTLNNITR